MTRAHSEVLGRFLSWLRPSLFLVVHSLPADANSRLVAFQALFVVLSSLVVPLSLWEVAPSVWMAQDHHNHTFVLYWPSNKASFYKFCIRLLLESKVRLFPRLNEWFSPLMLEWDNYGVDTSSPNFHICIHSLILLRLTPYSSDRWEMASPCFTRFTIARRTL